MNWSYRLWQFWNVFWAKPNFEGQELVEQLLTPNLAQIFASLDRSEQAHAIRVCRRLINEGETDMFLLTASLLHDIGKVRYHLSVWERVWIVLFEWFRKRLGISVTFEGDDPKAISWWKRPLLVGRFHPQWGAELLREHGVDERIVWLVEHHQEVDEVDSADPRVIWLRKLEIADQSS